MIRFGIVGTNWITERFIQGALETDQFALTAVYSRTEEKGRAFAAPFKEVGVFTDLQEMLERGSLDAVYIASPNSFHAQQAILCMNYGKHVLCEKPLASNAREVQEMIAAAKKNNVVLMEALKSMLMPNFKVIQDHLFKLGPIRRYFAGYCQYSSRYDAYKAGKLPNAFNAQFSNGSLMDLGIYCLYPLVALFGKPDLIKATAVMLPSGVDGEGSVIMRYTDMDMEGVMMHSKICNSYLPAEIQGELGTMVIDKINQPYNVNIYYRDGNVEELTKPQVHEPMYYEVVEFINMVKRGERESKVISHTNSLAVAEIMEEARQQIGLRYAADEIG